MSSNESLEGVKIQTFESTDILQAYLEKFNKEIGTSSNEEGILEETSGTFFMDQNGQYYFQPSTDQDSSETIIQELPENFRISHKTNENTILPDVVTVDEEVTIAEEQGNMIMPNQVYQTLTIVPSECVDGEVSYMLIVQGPDEKILPTQEIEENNLTVYDFDENEELEAQAIDSDEADDDKTKIIKLPIIKKSQTVAQPHMCNYCTYTSTKRYLLARHMKSHSEERPHKCSVCDRGFKTLASLQNHVNTHTGIKPHKCRYCESAFTTSGELVRHVRYRHTHEKPHKCTECDYASVELSKLKRHVRCHTGERPYVCQHCTYASPDPFKLKRHMRTHTQEKPYECETCHMRFTQSNSLKAHRLTHNVEEKPVFPCALCPTTCSRKTDLRIHIQKLHTSDQPLQCKRCGKSFPDRYTFKMHNKSHEGEKCFKCDQCTYASASQRHLNSHMLIHTDEKPFACDLCDQTFRQKQLLKRHQNLYHNPDYKPPSPKLKIHECQECTRSFRHKGNLIRHMASHDPDSSVSEKNRILKLGRQKKIHIINGRPIEVTTSMVETDEEEETVVLTEADNNPNDMEQYVVLEVIQLKSENNEDQITVITQNDYENSEDVDTHEKKVDMSIIKANEAEEDMKNCFGFDEDIQEEEIEQGQVMETTEQVHISLDQLKFLQKMK